MTSSILPCGCWPAVSTRRCGNLQQLVNLKNATGKAAASEPDAERRARLWAAHHGYVVEIAAHLSEGQGGSRTGERSAP